VHLQAPHVRRPTPGVDTSQHDAHPADPHGADPMTAEPMTKEPAVEGPAPAGPATSLTQNSGSARQEPSAELPTAVDPLAGDVPLERHRLSPLVTRYWRWRAIFSAVPAFVVLIGLAVVVPWGPTWLRWTIVGVLAAVVAVGIVLLPPIRYRVFWYAISPAEIDIQHGIIFIKRSVVPMHRVQTLRTERGPMADHYRMTNLTIKTAAGSVTISGLDRTEADELCDRISRLADVADDV
jgi:membrane protein YdbS with pleckstrin-like domain